MAMYTIISLLLKLVAWYCKYARQMIDKIHEIDVGVTFGAL